MLSINHLANCHNNKDIIFCKTDFIVSEFDKINKLKQNIVLITGNSDYPISDRIVSLCPKNVTKWYAENAFSNDDRIIPIPIGIENQFECKRKGHGIAFTERYFNKQQSINKLLQKNIRPQKFIYANFNTQTNFLHREHIKNFILNLSYVTWSDPILSYDNLYTDILNHKMVLCPSGNGLDTHRLWEVLYCNRVPIVISLGNYKLYKLYSKLPIIIIDSVDKMLDIDYINSLYEKIQNQSYNLANLLSINYWQNLILNSRTNNDQ